MSLKSELLNRFLKGHLDLIKENNFDELYVCARYVGQKFANDLTTALLTADINPQKYLTKLPEYYMFGNRTLDCIDVEIQEFEGTNHFSSSCINSIKFCEGVSYIPQACCAYCYNLNSLCIPSSVTRIKAHAFVGCGNLQYIVFKGTVEQWKHINVEYANGVWQGVPADRVLCIDGECSLIPVYTI